MRDVRAGRTEESFGEDPYLTSVMAEVYCKAFREEGIIATPKHFVANFVGDGGRDSNEIHFSERILREIYLPGFKASIKAGALSVMAAYNSLDGIPCSCNKWLLTEVLRWEWSFEGFVVSDYRAIKGIIEKHHITDDPTEAAKLALEAGLDVEMPRIEIYGDNLIKAVKEGLIPEEVIDEAVKRVLRVKFLIGLFDEPFVDPEYAEKICECEEHLQLVLQAEREAIVLLKNENNILPLSKDKVKSIAVIGPLSDELRLGGYSGKPRKIITPLEAIRKIADELGIKVLHAKGCPPDIGMYLPIAYRYLRTPNGEEGFIIEYYDNPDLKGEPIYKDVVKRLRFDWGYDRPIEGIKSEQFSVRLIGKLIPPITARYKLCVVANGGFRLWLNEKLLLDYWDGTLTIPRTISIRLEANHEYNIKLEYRHLSGYAYLKLSWDIDEITNVLSEAIEIAKKADAVLLFVGITEGEGKDRASLRLPSPQERLVNEVLKVNKNVIVVLITGSAVVGDWIYQVPALIQAWYPGQVGSIAIAEVIFGKYSPAGRLPFSWPHHEGQLPLYYNFKPSGRRYDYIDMPSTPLFPFGYGLSYTKFKYKNLKVEIDKKTWNVRVTFDVENVGNMKSDEVVQLYIRDVNSSIARPFRELRRFKRITLEPHETKSVSFVLTPDDFAMYDNNMRRVVEPGEYEILIGSSSDDIRLKAKVQIEEALRAKVRGVLELNKKEISVNEPVMLKVKVINEGPISDLVPIALYVNNEKIEEHKLDLDAKEEREVNFKLIFRKRGIYKIAVGFPKPMIKTELEVK